MSRAKGSKKTGGKPKGYTDENVKSVREKLNLFVTAEWDEIVDAFGQLKREDPAKYLSLITSWFEFCMPKLARTETDITSKGESLQLPKIEFVKSDEYKDKW